SAANAAQSLPGSATLTFSVSDASGSPVADTPVTFAQKAGEDLVTLSAGSASSTPAGKVTVTATSNDAIGVSHIIASLPNDAAATISLPVLRAPAASVGKPMPPAVTRRHGPGIQEP